MKTFPIRLDDEVKTIPWDMIADARMRVEALGQPVKTVEEMAVIGMTPEEAIAFITNKPWERMGAAHARMRLLQLVEEWKVLDAETREALGMPVVRGANISSDEQFLQKDEGVKLAREREYAPSIIPEPRDLADKTLADIAKGRALALSMQRRVNVGSCLHREYETILKILDDTAIAVRALRHRRPN